MILYALNRQYRSPSSRAGIDLADAPAFLRSAIKPWMPASWLAIVVTCCLVGVSRAGQFGSFTYTDDGSSVTITDYPEDAVGPVVIPSTIDGMPVVRVGDFAFQDCDRITSVFVPSTVTKLGELAFAHCSALASITIPTSVEAIGGWCFENCDGLVSMTIPGSVTEFGISIFSGCSFLVSVDLAPGLQRIPTRMFWECHHLADVSIPPTVRTIGDSAFARCFNLVDLPEIENVVTLEDSAFSQTSLKSVRIPGSVKNIGDKAFYNCLYLKSVVIEPGNVNVGNYAFQDCAQLGSLDLGETTGTIGGYVFAGCDSLHDLDLPSSWFEKGWGTFNSCFGLTHIKIPKGVSRLASYLFSNCKFLGSVVFEGDAPEVNESAFLSTSRAFFIYYHRGASGFTGSIWSGYRTIELGPEIQVRDIAGNLLASGGAPREIGETIIGDHAFLDLEISNGGDFILTGLAISTSGPHRSEFKLSRLSATSLPPGKKLVVRVEFSPDSLGKRSCTLQIANSDLEPYPFELRLAGRGIRPPGPEIVVKQPGGRQLVDGKSRRGFPRVKVGSKSTVKTFRIKNVGNKNLKKLSIHNTGAAQNDFIVTPLRRQSLGPGESVTFKVCFKPRSKGSRSATIHIKSDDADEKSFDIKLRGSGK